MNDDLQEKFDTFIDSFETAFSEESRAVYREVLEELQSYCQVALDALDEDDERETKR
jgi:hypothetical protein